MRVPRERQETLLDEFERSGLSGAKFAAFCGVKYPRFTGWVQRRKKQRAAGAATGNSGTLQWLDAVVGGGAPGGALPLYLPGLGILLLPNRWLAPPANFRQPCRA